MKYNEKNEAFDVKVVRQLDFIIVKLEKYPRIIRLPIAYFFILLGILLLVLPGPGTVFILAGVALISKKFGDFLTNQMERYIRWRNRQKAQLQ